MQFSSLARRLETSKGKWELHLKVRELAAAGEDVIELTLGEPDIEVPEELKESAIAAIRRGRTKYAAEQGEPELLKALAQHYTARAKRPIEQENVLCFPGTQTALYATMMTLVGPGDEVLVGDPMYATYEAVVRSTGATVVPVSLKPGKGFRLQAGDIESCLTPRSRAVLLTTPHNPSGSILSRPDIAKIADLCLCHDLWIISDEVYADLIFENESFVSPLELHEIKDRVVVVSSISKSHAAPGFRSGWSIGPKDFIEACMPLCDTMLFGNQPFIADMTVDAIRMGSSVIAGMRERYAARARRLELALGHGNTVLDVYRPQAGMFSLIDVNRTGFSGQDFARELLDKFGVATMPGSSFGTSIDSFIRVGLTANDIAFNEALKRIVLFCESLQPEIRAFGST